MDAKQYTGVLLLLRFFEPYVSYKLHTIQLSHYHKPISNKQREEVIPRCIITHFPCLKVIRDIFQLPWVYFKDFDTHFFCFKTVMNKKKCSWVLAHCLASHLLSFKIIKDVFQLLYTPSHSVIAHILSFKMVRDIF